MNTAKQPFKWLCALLALMLAILPASLAEGSFQAVVSADSMTVYAPAAPHGALGALPKGTEVTVTAWSGSAALITGGGLTGIARVSDMRRAAADSPDGSAAKSMVTNRDTRVYQRASTASRYVSIQKGTALQLLAVSGSAAQVSLDGRVGFTAYAHLSEPDAANPTDETPDATDPGTVQTGNLAVVTTQSAQIYEHADYTGEFVSVGKDTSLTLLAYRGDCAMVSKNGNIGYTQLSVLKKAATPAQTAAPETKTKANPFPSGSNEYTIYKFLTGEMSLNRAAAMGVMANIYYESSYKPNCNGDSGTSYGICQWHAGRKTNLINWCKENGLDYTTLEGQLRFLKYELPSRYPSVDKYIRQVENTADGAYDAAYYFCFNFEAPANRTAQSTKRGNYAKNTLFPKK